MLLVQYHIATEIFASHETFNDGARNTKQQKYFHEMDQSHKSHNAPVPYATIHHIGTEIYTFLFQGGVLWDMEQMHHGICEIGL